MVTLIAAVGKNYELGYKNKLLWHMKKDMLFFKSTTINHTVVMGRKTYESIGKPLPGRNNIVISHKKIDRVKTTDHINEILSMDKNEIFIIGGASIYEYFIHYADRIYLTEIDDEKVADAYFPTFDKTLYDRKILKKAKEADIKYQIVLYTRK